MKKIFLYSAVALVTLATSCSKLDDNISPNNPDPATLSPRQLLTAAENLTFSAQAGTLNSLSNVWTNTWAGNDYYFGNPLTREYTLDIGNTFANGIWSSNYIAVNNLQGIINKESNFPLHSAIARVLKAYSMQYIVDFYGKAPYSEAFKMQENLTPKYDDDAAIYKGLVLELNQAIANIDNFGSNAPADIVVSPSEDVIFGGDMNKWKLFAKNVKLKLLLRQSNVVDAGVRSFVDAELASLATGNPSDFFLDNVAINPGYSNNNGSTVNPWFGNFGATDFSGHSINANGWRLYKAAEYYANNVNGTNFPGGDKRGPKQFGRLSTNDNLGVSTVVGRAQGMPKPAGKTEWSFAFIGWKFAPNSLFYDFAVNGNSQSGEDLAEAGASMDGYFALGSENKLLLAEAAVLYPALFSFDAQTLYNDAVADSYVFYGLNSSDASAYLSGLNSTTVGWSGAPSHIAAIQYQRLVSLANLRQVETYVNFLKTGYPEIPVAGNAIYNNKPYRLIYPITEYTGNSSNVIDVPQAQCFTKNQNTPFWNR